MVLFEVELTQLPFSIGARVLHVGKNGKKPRVAN